MPINVQLVLPWKHDNCVLQLRANEPTVMGRGKHGIDGLSVSREHLEVYLEGDDVFMKSLSKVNPSYVWEKGAKEPTMIREGATMILKDGDAVSLLRDDLKFHVCIQSSDRNVESSIDLPTIPSSSFDMILDEPEPPRRAVKRKRESEKTPPPKRKALARCESSFMQHVSSIQPEEITFIKRVGVGSCGEVWEADWNGNRVAVKKIMRSLLAESVLAEFKSEARILGNLKPHPNVVQMFGIIRKGEDYCLVTEFMKRGTLTDVIKESKTNPINEKTLLNYAMGAAEGIRYLHSCNPPVIHRDIKSMNFLVDDSGAVKVADFGLAKYMKEDKTKTFCGTMCWAAPELLEGKLYNTKIDVYSFGIVLWELVTGEEPYNGLNQVRIGMEVVKGTLRPTIPASCDPALAELMTQCWAQDPEDRPTMAQVLASLKRLSSPVINTISRASTIANESMMLTMVGSPRNSVKQCERRIIDYSLIKKVKTLCEGPSYVTYVATVNEFRVCVREMKPDTSDEVFKAFVKEAEVIDSIQSPHVLEIYAFCQSPRCVVSEYLESGCVYDILASNDLLALPFVLRLMFECTKAVTVLHTWVPPIIHQTLNPNKFLLAVKPNSNEIAFIRIRGIGSGNAFTVTKGELKNVPTKGGIRYCAPEVLNGGRYTTESDVYSFGIIMWEAFHRVFSGSLKSSWSQKAETNTSDFITDVNKGIRPDTSSLPIELRELLALCWNTLPSNRSNFGQLSAFLAQLLERDWE